MSSTALDQALAKACLAAQPAFDTSHAAVIALVIIAKKVQKTMQCQHAELRLERVPGIASLAACHAVGDHDIA